MEQLKVIFLIGPSGCGKTTWASKQNGFKIISLDELRIELCGNINDKSKDEEAYKLAVERMFLFLSNNHSVILDTTNLKKERRKIFLDKIYNDFRNVTTYYKLFDIIDVEQLYLRIKSDINKGKLRSNVSKETIIRHCESLKNIFTQLKKEKLTRYE